MSLPLDHLSASSISLFLRCPRQFQENYIRGAKDGPVSSAVVIGRAVHLGLSRLLKEEPIDGYFDDALRESINPVIWKDKESACRKIADKMLLTYYHRVGRSLNVLETEQELLLDLPGVDIPLLGYVDILTDRGVIDVKTTGYVSRQPELQNSWKLQMNIYQLKHPKPGEFHVLTRSSTNPIVVPDTPGHPFYVNPPRDSFADNLRKIYKVMVAYYEQFGDTEDWPGNITHEWAAKYCPLKGLGCCQD